MRQKWNSGLVPHYPSGNGSEEASMIGTRLRRLRLARGLTQRELAEPKYTHAYVSTIEAGRRNPSREALEHFAGKLGVDVDELLTGKPEEALQHYQRAEEIVRSGPADAMADAVAGKARCFQALGDVRYAIHILESLVDSLDRDGIRDPNALARLYSSLLDAYMDAGLVERAAASAIELERLGPRLTDPVRIGQMHMHVAHMYLVQGRVEDAQHSLQRAEDAHRQLDLQAETGHAYLAKGYVKTRDGRLDEARQDLEHALAIFEETSDEKDLTRTLNELARIERLEGRTDRARELLERSISIMGDSDTPILAWAHRELGLVLTESEPDGAEKNFRLAIELFERSEQAVEIAVTYRALGDLLHAQGEGEASCEAYRTGILALEPRL